MYFGDIFLFKFGSAYDIAGGGLAQTIVVDCRLNCRVLTASDDDSN